MSRVIKGLTNIKTDIKSENRSKHNNKGSEYLNLYLKIKEKERLEKRSHSAKRSSEDIETALKNVKNKVWRLERALRVPSKACGAWDGDVMSEKKVPQKIRKMPIEY